MSFNKNSGIVTCLSIIKFSRKVPETGIEPARPCGHMTLNHARLPIPPFGQLNQHTNVKNPAEYGRIFFTNFC